MPFDEQDRATLDATKADILQSVNTLIADKFGDAEKALPAKVKQALDEVFNGETPADIGEQFAKFQKNTEQALTEMAAKQERQRADAWRNSAERIRFQSGAFDGVGIELLEPLAFTSRQLREAGKNAADDASIAQGLKHVNENPREIVEAHFAALREKVGKNSIIQALENAALGRERNPFEPGGVLNAAGGRFILQANEITSTEAAAAIQPTLDATLWADMMLEAGVSMRIPQQPMPTQQHSVPNFDDVLIDALNDGTSMAIARGELDPQQNQETTLRRTTFNARTITLATALTQTAMEDTPIGMAMEVRDRMIEAGAYGLENFVINSDPTAGATAANGSSGNINASAAANTLTRLGATGLRAFCIADASRQRDAGGDALTNADIQAARGILIDVATVPGNYFYAMPASTYFAAQAVDEFARYDAAAQVAALLTGRLTLPGMGSPVVVSPGMAQRVTASGRKSGTANNNTLGHMLLVVPSQWRLGVRVPFRLYSAEGVLDHNINPMGMNFLLRGRFDITVRNQTEVHHTRPAALIRNISV